MPKNSLRTAILSIALLSYAPHANATCEYALIKDVESHAEDVNKNLAMLSIIDKRSFESKRDALSAGDDAIIGGIPIHGDMSWQTFREEKDSYFSKYQLDYSNEEHRQYARAYLSSISAKAHKDCLLGTKPVGLILWVEKNDPTFLQLGLAFNTAGGDKTKRHFTKPDVKGGTFSEESLRYLNAKFRGPTARTLTFTKTPCEPISISIAIEGTQHEDSIYVPPPKIIEHYEETITKETPVSKRKTSHSGGDTTGLPETVCVRAEGSEKLIPSTATLEYSLTGSSPEAPHIQVDTNDETAVCRTFHALPGLNGSATSAEQAYVRVSAKRPATRVLQPGCGISQ